MKIKLKILFALTAFSIFSFSEEENLEKGDIVLKDRGVEKLNFYHPVKEQNKFSTFTEFDFRPDKNIYQWTLAEGYQSITNLWDFNYKIEKEFHQEKNREKPDSHVWDNEISLVRRNKDKKIGNSTWAYRTFFKINHAETDGKKIQRTSTYKFYGGQKISSFLSLGKGGTYVEFEAAAGGVKGSLKNGYSLLVSLKTGSNLGYGIQWSNTFENEYMNYNQYRKINKSKWETLLKWTYELNENWAFSPELNFKIENFIPKKQENYAIESTIGSYILYSKNLNDRLRIFGKIGPSYRIEKSKSKDFHYSKSGFAGYARLGIEYIF
ncbi:hypothetical protein EII29_01570 [Leptotrichia sp. OH3620_COT-345]|uniref:outer membrane beta-barrel protein n=1 Tax=Leptotrichia sp. OH3620_COT-345 TaxID=2491048 RepID=UPI000F64A2AE|nr:outer membrane beta-barrel protein [Leptotrichia sp. OH3620_COT-345]RRD40651.1 hypothetical protein EII29_01570 [Leptotrichia sp. OH3620_COT-345]